MSPFATLNLFHNCFGYLTTSSLSQRRNAILLYGNLAFTSSGLALKFFGKILKTTTPKNFTVLKH